MPVNIPDINSVQFFFIILSPENMQPGVIGLIKDSIIMKRHKHSFINGFLQRNLIWHIIITDFVYIPSIHTFRRCRQSQEKLWPEIFHDPSILVIYGMMEFVRVCQYRTTNFFKNFYTLAESFSFASIIIISGVFFPCSMFSLCNFCIVFTLPEFPRSINTYTILSVFSAFPYSSICSS